MSLKNFIFIFAVTIAVLFSFSRPVLALTGVQQDIAQQLGAAAGAQGAGYGDPEDPRLIAAKIIRAILGLVGTIFIVLTIYAGFLWMTAGGNEEQVTKSKTLLTQATFGLMVILLAYGITALIFNIALGKGLNSYSWFVNPSFGPQQ